MTTANFGALVRKRRLELGLSLRRFCDIAQVDPSNWSKIERNRLPVTTDANDLLRIAGILQLPVGSKEWHDFYNLAFISQQLIPADVYSDEELVGVLPVVFRTLKGDPPSDEELDELIQLLKSR